MTVVFTAGEEDAVFAMAMRTTCDAIGDPRARAVSDPSTADAPEVGNARERMPERDAEPSPVGKTSRSRIQPRAGPAGAADPADSQRLMAPGQGAARRHDKCPIALASALVRPWMMLSYARCFDVGRIQKPYIVGDC
ncbi:MAG TPA: hypothetical protein VMR43_19415, partial [Variovorax sp.]|nr:hypothetical protein [Variovorax sp.]